MLLTVTDPTSAGALAGAPKSSGKVFQSLQAGRGIAALMVVFYHCEGICSLSKYWDLKSHLFYFGASGVDFFFVLSGIVIFYAHRADIDEPSRLGAYVWKRVRRIYPLYWSLLLPVLPLYFLVPSFGSGLEREPAVILGSFLLLPITRTETIIPVAWTLFHEVLFYLVFAVLLFRKRLGAIVFGCWMLASLLALAFTPHNPVLATYVSPLHLLFGAGLLVLVAVRRFSLPALTCAMVGISGFVACAVYDDLYRPSSAFLPLGFGFAAAVAAAGFMSLEQQGRLKVPDFLVFLGDASYSLYLVHYAVLSATAKLVFAIWKRHPTPMVIPFCILLTAAIASGTAVHLVLERPLLRLLPRNVRIRRLRSLTVGG